MAMGKASDFKVYQAEFIGGVTEAIVRNVNLFNAASAGTVKLFANAHRGEYWKQSFFKDISGLISRRDLTSVAAATDSPMTQDENIFVKVSRKIGPVSQTFDAWRKIEKDQSEMSFILGQMVGERKALDMVDTAISAAIPAIGQIAANITDQSAAGTPTLTHTHLATMLSLMGDQANRVRAFVMHSKAYFDLVKQAIADKVTEVAGVTIINGTVATFNRPVIVTDSASLLVAGSPNKYYTLGLVEDAIVCMESEQQEIVSQLITGFENLAVRVQGEYSYTLGLKGFKWDITNGGANPASAAIITATNWDKVVTQDKDTFGVRLFTQ